MQEDQAPLPVGTVIHKHYIVKSLLGKGDFGNVYLVQAQRDKQRLFAFAELINPLGEGKYHFTLDYISHAPLDRQALPHIQYVLHDDKLGRAFLLMSYIEEPNLEIQRLQQAEQRFPLVQVITTLIPVMDAVTYLHNQQPLVIHENIQPSSIIISPTIDAPVLAMLNILQDHNTTITPVHYLAPGYGATEQYGGEFSARTDIYGLGATCYTLLTGIIPPDALSRATQVSHGGLDPLKPVHEVLPAIPTLLAEAIQQAMSINAEDRFSSVEQFQEMFVSAVRQPALKVASALSLIPSLPLAVMPELPDTPHTSKLNGIKPAAFEQAGEIPVAASVSEQRRASYTQKSGTSELIAFMPVVETPALTSIPKPPYAARMRKLGILLIILALLIGLGTEAGSWFHARSLSAAHSTTPIPMAMQSSPTPVPTPTPVPSIYPKFTGTYIGTIYNLAAKVPTNMSLSIQQNKADISGYLTLGQGSEPFKGTIDTTEHFQFIVTDTAGHARLFFEGMQSRGSLNGIYYSCRSIDTAQGSRCSQTHGSYGIWSVMLTSS